MNRMCGANQEDDDGQADVEDIAVDELKHAASGRPCGPQLAHDRLQRRRPTATARLRAAGERSAATAAAGRRPGARACRRRRPRARPRAPARARNRAGSWFPPSDFRPAPVRRAGAPARPRRHRARARARAAPASCRPARSGRGERLVEPAPVPEARLRAADAAVPGLDRERHAAVPFERRAGVVGDRALAAELEQAPALARALIVEALGEQAALVERPAIAAVVDRLAEEHFRPAQVRRAPAACRRQTAGRACRPSPSASAGSRKC